jgi:hypothetical protein
MAQKFEDWLAKQVGEDWSKAGVVHEKVKTAKGKAKGKQQSDLAVVENILNHIVTAGVYPQDPALENIDFDQLI